MDLVWLVPYEPGVLAAKGRRDGKVACEKEVTTSGTPAKIQLLADRESIAADGQDVVHIEINILGAKNHFVPDASNEMTFKVEGDASIIAVDNGDPLNEYSFNGTTLKAFNGKGLVIIRSTKEKGEFTFYAESEGLAGAQVSVSTR